MTPEDLLEILQKPGFLPKLWTAEYSSQNPEDKTSIRQICVGQEKPTQTIRLNHLRSSPIPWNNIPGLYHIIDTITTSAKQAKTQHLHSNGAKKVLLANSDVEHDISRFRPNITNNHRRKYQVQNLIFAHEVCSPWSLRTMFNRILGSSEDNVLKQATSVVDLMRKSLTFRIIENSCGDR